MPSEAAAGRLPDPGGWVGLLGAPPARQHPPPQQAAPGSKPSPPQAGASQDAKRSAEALAAGWARSLLTHARVIKHSWEESWGKRGNPKLGFDFLEVLPSPTPPHPRPGFQPLLLLTPPSHTGHLLPSQKRTHAWWLPPAPSRNSPPPTAPLPSAGDRACSPLPAGSQGALARASLASQLGARGQTRVWGEVLFRYVVSGYGEGTPRPLPAACSLPPRGCSAVSGCRGDASSLGKTR